MQAIMSKWCDWIQETDPDILQATYKSRLLESGFRILGELDYHFQPYGYTKIYLLAESHFAIHTFPEENKTYIELSSCNVDKYNKFLQLQGDV